MRLITSVNTEQLQTISSGVADTDNLNSAGATAGQVLTADGASGTLWADVSAGDTDNSLVRLDTAGGNTLQGSVVVIGDSGEIHGYRGSRNAQTGTTYEIVSTDAGKVITLTNASPIACTVSNDLPVDFVCTIIQGGAGQVTFSAEAGGAQRNRQTHDKTAGQWAICGVYVFANSDGSSAEYILSGDTA